MDFLTTEERIKVLEDLLRESKRKARLAEKVIETESYKEFQSWIAGQVMLKAAPIIEGKDSLTTFTSRCLIASGVGEAGGYFESFKKNIVELEAQLRELRGAEGADLDEWDIDAPEE